MLALCLCLSAPALALPASSSALVLNVTNETKFPVRIVPAGTANCWQGQDIKSDAEAIWPKGVASNRPIYTVVGDTLDGEREILGLWAGDGSEGAKYWHQVLSEVKNRGARDALFVCCELSVCFTEDVLLVV